MQGPFSDQLLRPSYMQKVDADQSRNLNFFFYNTDFNDTQPTYQYNTRITKKLNFLNVNPCSNQAKWHSGYL